MLTALPNSLSEDRRAVLVHKVTQIHILMKEGYQDNFSKFHPISLEIVQHLKEILPGSFNIVKITLFLSDNEITQENLQKLITKHSLKPFDLMLVESGESLRLCFIDSFLRVCAGSSFNEGFAPPSIFYKFMWQNGLTDLAVAELYKDPSFASLKYQPLPPFGILSGQWLDWFMCNYRTLGRGNYGTVESYSIGTSNIAVKRSPNIHRGVNRELMREAAYYQRFSHPNILKLVDIFTSFGSTALIFPQALGDFVKYKEQQIKIKGSVLLQMTRAIAYLHSEGILHGDLKETNFLYFKNKDGQIQVVLADFGLAVKLPYVEDQSVFIYWYRAPEIILGSKYTEASDIWALGCVFFRILAETHLFVGATPKIILEQITAEFGKITEDNWPDSSKLSEASILQSLNVERTTTKMEDYRPKMDVYFDLIRSMLQVNPAERISAFEIFHSSVFDDIRDELSSPLLAAADVLPINDRRAVLSQIAPVLNFPQANFKDKLAGYFYFLELQERQKITIDLFSQYILLYERSFHLENICSQSHQLAVFSIIINFYLSREFKTGDFAFNNIIAQAKLQILKELKYDLIYTTSFDVMRVLHSSYSSISLTIARSLLYFSYLTSLSSKHDSIVIVHLIYSLVARFFEKEEVLPTLTEVQSFYQSSPSLEKLSRDLSAAEELLVSELGQIRQLPQLKHYCRIISEKYYQPLLILDKLFP